MYGYANILFCSKRGGGGRGSIDSSILPFPSPAPEQNVYTNPACLCQYLRVCENTSNLCHCRHDERFRCRTVVGASDYRLSQKITIGLLASITFEIVN